MVKYEEFTERYNSFSEREAEKKKQSGRISNWRLFAFLAGAAVSVMAFILGNAVYGLLATVLSLVIFVYLIIWHKRISHELARLSQKVCINKMYMQRIQSGWIEFEDCGQEFTDPGNPFTGDLDIFGPKSLFQWINTAKTYFGRVKLKELLESPDKSVSSIRMRQCAVRELSGKLDFCQELQSEGMLAKGVEHDPESLLRYAEEQSGSYSRNKNIVNLYYIMPGIVITAFALVLMGARVPLFIPLLLLCVQMIIFAAGYRKNTAVVNSVYGLKNHLGAYVSMLALIEREDFDDPQLNGLKKQLFMEKDKASALLRKLESISNAVDLKYSTVLYFLLNIAFLWDFHCAFALEEWKYLYGGKTRIWLETVGRMEALASLAVIGHMYPEWVFPVFLEDRLKFAAEGMGHPLLQKDVCVCNNFVINKGACVITGSNMSGKTTLLRTVGINLVLAYAGAPVFAEKLECSVMDVFTSMRVRDDLNSGISTFYAELLRIKMIVEHSQKELPMIYMIDEIFMGTNSLDRITGARSVLKNLSKSWIIGMISTHDFELCDLEQESNVNVKNYHFTEKYVNNEIRFDYKLKPGRSRTTNAKYLMRMVGIELEG